MKIALYDCKDKILDYYKGLLEELMRKKIINCEIDCYTNREELISVMETYDIVLMSEYAMKYITNVESDEEVILVSGNRVETVTINDIVYIEADLKHIHIFLKDGGEIVIRMTFKDVEEQLFKTDRAFVKIHRSYIVAMDMIRSIENRSVKLKNGSSLPVSKYRLQNVIDSYVSYQEGQSSVIKET